MQKQKLNIPDGTILGSEEEKLQKAEKKKSEEERIAEFLEFLKQQRKRKTSKVWSFKDDSA